MLTHVKNYKSAYLLAYKQGLWVICSHGREQAELGSREGVVKGIGSRQSRIVKVRAVEGWGGKCPIWPEAWWPETRQPESQENKPFVLRTYIVGRVRVKELHID